MLQPNGCTGSRDGSSAGSFWHYEKISDDVFSYSLPRIVVVLCSGHRAFLLVFWAWGAKSRDPESKLNLDQCLSDAH